MRILQIGDTHLGIRGSLIGAPRGVNRASDHLDAFDAALRPAFEGAVDAVIHTGDLFDRSRPPRGAVVAAADRLVRLARRMPVLVIAGNHDRRGLARYIPHRLLGLQIVDTPRLCALGPLRVAAIPFIRRPGAWAAAAAGSCASGVDLLVAHQAFEGDRVPGFRFRVGRPADTLGEEHLPSGLRWILSGHLHPHQAVDLGGCTVVHGGSTERTALSERAQAKGSVIWSWGREVRWEFSPGPTRKAVMVEQPADLSRVGPGSWVAVRGGDPELEAQVRRRGAYLSPARTRAEATPQRAIPGAEMLLPLG